MYQQRGWRSIRLQEHDYSAGAYFVTVCVQEWRPLFGQIRGGQMFLSDAGRMAQTEWLTLPERFRGLQLDELVVMPDHFHALLWLTQHAGSPSLGAVVGAWKSISTVRYIDGVEQAGWTPFRKRLWQRHYYERIVRNEEALCAIRTYIRANPARRGLSEEALVYDAAISGSRVWRTSQWASGGRAPTTRRPTWRARGFRKSG